MDLDLAGNGDRDGRSRGIGKAIVRQLAMEGVDVGIAAATSSASTPRRRAVDADRPAGRGSNV